MSTAILPDSPGTTRRKPRVERLAELSGRAAAEAQHLAIVHPAAYDLAVIVAELAEETRLIARAIDGAV